MKKKIIFEYTKLKLFKVENQNILDELPFAVIVYDLDIQQNIYANLSAKNLLKKFFDQEIETKEDLLLIREKLFNDILKMKEFDFEKNIKGHFCWDSEYYVYFFKRLKSEPAKNLCLLTIYDNTELKNLEDQILENELKFRTILENMPILLDAFDKNGNIIVWNKACEESTGYKAEEMIGNPNAMDLLYPNKEYKDFVFKISDEPTPYENITKLRAKDGSQRIIKWFDIYKKFQLKGWASWGLGIDITEIEEYKKKLEEQNKKYKKLFLKYLKKSKNLKILLKKSKESDKLKSIFLANISHEIRNPMNAIIGFAQLLKEENLDYRARLDYIEIIEQSSYNLLNVIENILTASKIQSKEEDLDFSIVDIKNFIERVVKNFKSKNSNHLFVRYDLFDGVNYVFIDKKKLLSVFEQLLSNADKYTKNGKIVIDVRKNDENVLICVEDTGIGIPKDKQKSIFRKFAKFDEQEAIIYGGTGLGLYIVKSYINMMGGDIWVESEPSKGSKFYFTLPYLERVNFEINKYDIGDYHFTVFSHNKKVTLRLSNFFESEKLDFTIVHNIQKLSATIGSYYKNILFIDDSLSKAEYEGIAEIKGKLNLKILYIIFLKSKLDSHLNNYSFIDGKISLLVSKNLFFRDLYKIILH